MDVFFAFIAWYIFFKLTDHFLAARGHRGKVTDHFNGKTFYSYGSSPDSVRRRPPLSRMLKFVFLNKRSPWKRRQVHATTKPASRIVGARLTVTFINHSTLLIQTEGKNILTDPVWSKRASPFSFIGPSRFQDPGVDFEDLPEIDLVLISHNHYDHMDLATLRRVEEKWHPPILVGLGNAPYLTSKGLTNVIEMDWWDEHVVDPALRVVAAPGQHFSSRALSDRDNTLWCGFFIETPHGDIYFAGDTGYGAFVHRIREKYSQFRLALLPIGAFRPQWFMGPVHISPEQAVDIYDELRVHAAIGIHHSTFHLADDGQDEPEEIITELKHARTEKPLDFRVPKNGEVFEID